MTDPTPTTPHGTPAPSPTTAPTPPLAPAVSPADASPETGAARLAPTVAANAPGDAVPAFVRHALDAHELGGDGQPDLLASLRARARRAFETAGVPTRRDEAWKYTDLRPALAPDYAPVPAPDADALSADDVARYAVPGMDAARVVVLDGHVLPHLSDLGGLPAGVTVGSLAEALAAGDETALAHAGRHADVEADAFTALNTMARADGVFVHVPRGVAAERAVHVIHLQTAAAPAFVQTRSLVVVGEAAQATVVETYARLGEAPTFRNDVTEIVAGRGAVVRHVRVQNEGDNAHGVSRVATWQDADAAIDTLTFTFASGLVRNHVAMLPAGLGGTATLGGLYICHGTQHVDTSTLVDHVAPGCVSNELYKGIVYDRSVGVFNGKVFVRREGQQTNAYQQSQGVVLSPEAKHFSKPELEIYADDVKCSHGSTTGAVVPEHVFYLRSRGVSERDARAMLLYAFAHDVVAMVHDEALRDHLDALIADRLT